MTDTEKTPETIHKSSSPKTPTITAAQSLDGGFSPYDDFRPKYSGRESWRPRNFRAPSNPNERCYLAYLDRRSRRSVSGCDMDDLSYRKAQMDNLSWGRKAKTPGGRTPTRIETTFGASGLVFQRVSSDPAHLEMLDRSAIDFGPSDSRQHFGGMSQSVVSAFIQQNQPSFGETDPTDTSVTAAPRQPDRTSLSSDDKNYNNSNNNNNNNNKNKNNTNDDFNNSILRSVQPNPVSHGYTLTENVAPYIHTYSTDNTPHFIHDDSILKLRDNSYTLTNCREKDLVAHTHAPKVTARSASFKEPGNTEQRNGQHSQRKHTSVGRPPSTATCVYCGLLPVVSAVTGPHLDVSSHCTAQYSAASDPTALYCAGCVRLMLDSQAIVHQLNEEYERQRRKASFAPCKPDPSPLSSFLRTFGDDSSLEEGEGPSRACRAPTKASLLKSFELKRQWLADSTPLSHFLRSFGDDGATSSRGADWPFRQVDTTNPATTNHATTSHATTNLAPSWHFQETEPLRRAGCSSRLPRSTEMTRIAPTGGAFNSNFNNVGPTPPDPSFLDRYAFAGGPNEDTALLPSKRTYGGSARFGGGKPSGRKVTPLQTGGPPTASAPDRYRSDGDFDDDDDDDDDSEFHSERRDTMLRRFQASSLNYSRPEGSVSICHGDTDPLRCLPTTTILTTATASTSGHANLGTSSAGLSAVRLTPRLPPQPPCPGPVPKANFSASEYYYAHRGSMSGSFTSTSSSNTPVCRICQLPTDPPAHNPLISPCRCAGTMQWVHRKCLVHWLELSTRKMCPSPKCELCCYQYKTHHVLKIQKLHLPECSPRDKALHIIFLIMAIIMMTTATVSAVFLRGNEKDSEQRTSLDVSDVVIIFCSIVFFLAFVAAVFTQYRARTTLCTLWYRCWLIQKHWRIRNYDVNDDKAKWVSAKDRTSKC